MEKFLPFPEEMKSVSGLLPDSRYFSEYFPLDTNISLLISYNGCNFLVPAERAGSTAVVHPRVFAADLYSTTDVVLADGDYMEIFMKAETEFAKHGLTELKFKAIPNYISNVH